MEFRSEIGRHGVKTEDSKFCDSINFSVTSGPKSDEYIIDLKLADEVKTEVLSPHPKKVNLVSVQENVSNDETHNSWINTRSRYSAGRSINGWYYPVESESNSAGSEIEHAIEKVEEMTVASPLTPNLSTQEVVSDEVRSLLNETLQIFNDNADSFRENLNQLKNEVQTLPLFQGALQALNNTISEQKTEVNELKITSDMGLSNLIDGQKEIKILIDKLSKALGDVQNVSSSIAAQVKIDTTSEIISILKTANTTQVESMLKVENYLKAQDLSRFQGNLETIYKAVKRLVDDSRQGFTKIAQGLNDFSQKGTQSEETLKIDDLVDLHEEVSMHIEAILRIEKKLEKIKSKMLYGFAVGMIVLGLIFSSTMGAF